MATALLRNPHLLVLVLVILFVGGFNALRSLPRLEDPRLTNRNPVVLTFLPGASAEQVEAQITEPLERELREIAEVKEIESTSSLGVSSIALELADDVVDPAPVLADLRSALDRAERTLPPGVTRPWLDDQRGAAAYGLIVSLRWRASAAPDLLLLHRYADELADRLRRLDGTEIVRVHGDVDERVLVEPSPGELGARGIGMDQLAASALPIRWSPSPASSPRSTACGRCRSPPRAPPPPSSLRSPPCVAGIWSRLWRWRPSTANAACWSARACNPIASPTPGRKRAAPSWRRSPTNCRERSRSRWSSTRASTRTRASPISAGTSCSVRC